MVAKVASTPPLSQERRYRLYMRSIEGVITIVRSIIVYGSCLGMVYFVFRMVAELAGGETTANFVIQLIGSLQLDRWAAYLFAAMGITYGIREGHLRRKAVATLSKRTEELERRLDPSRTSSELTSAGTTRTEDH